MDEFNYWRAEFRKLGDTSEGGVRVKFWNPEPGKGMETRWLSLTPQQWDTIERAMLDIQED